MHINGLSSFGVRLMSGSLALVVALAGPPGPHRFSQGCRGMPSDPVLLEPYRPGPIDVLADQDPSPGIASAVRTWWDVDNQPAEPDGVLK